MRKYIIVLLLCLSMSHYLASAQPQQQQNRLTLIEQRLADLSQNVPGLNQKVETAVSNSSLQEFLKGLAATHNLNIYVDPSVNQKITGYFSDEKVINVLMYAAKQYNLDFTFTGSIISISTYNDPLANLPPPPRLIQIQYDPNSDHLTMDLQDDSLLQVAKKITQLTNKNVVLVPQLFFKKVSGYFQDMPVENVLEKLAIANSFKLNKTNDNVYVLEPLKEGEEIVTRENKNVSPNYSIKKTITRQPGSTLSNSINIESSESGKKFVNLNVVNAPIKDLIRDIAEQAGINYFMYSEITGVSTASVQNMLFNDVLTFILQGTKYTFNVDKDVYLIGDRNDEGLRKHKLIRLQHRSVDSLLAVIPQQIKGNVDIKEFKELNSFLLSGSEPEIKEIEGFVYQLDKTVPMVMIEVILMDVKKSKTIETGIKMGVSDSIVSGGTILGGLDFTFSSGDVNRFIDRIGLNNVFNIGRVTPNFYASLKALENNSNIDLRQTPKLSTLNGHAATLSIGSTRYYAASTQNVVGSLNPQTIVTQQFYPVEANLAIDIRPFVSGEEQVTLNIDINITDFIGNASITAPPPSATSKFKSIIRVKNEEMIVLGGIERNEKSDEGSGIPFLARIPVLKWLFSSRSKTTSKTVSVVFIKPSIFY
ncbi:MAG TPA: type II and III secretion system protein [Agriterribacter sp.]|nr:type II and III secretion system protein [Agriterribacter sp.]